MRTHPRPRPIRGGLQDWRVADDCQDAYLEALGCAASLFSASAICAWADRGFSTPRVLCVSSSARSLSACLRHNQLLCRHAREFWLGEGAQPVQDRLLTHIQGKITHEARQKSNQITQNIENAFKKQPGRTKPWRVALDSHVQQTLLKGHSIILSNALHK